MSIEQLEHIEELRRTYEKRLRILELQHARSGNNTSPEVIIEIEELRKKIADIDAEIARLKDIFNIERHAPPNELGRCVEIIINEDYRHWNPDLQNAAVRAFAAIIGISFDQIKVLRVRSGSVVMLLSMPWAAANSFIRLYKSGDPLLKEIGVISVRLPAIEIHEHESMQELDAFIQKTRAEIKSIENRIQLSLIAIGFIISYLPGIIIDFPTSPFEFRFILLLLMIIIPLFASKLEQTKQDKFTQIEVSYEQFIVNADKRRLHSEQYIK